MQMCDYVIRIRRGQGTLPHDANDVIEHVTRTVPNGGREEYERQRALYPPVEGKWLTHYFAVVQCSKLGPQCSSLIFPDSERKYYLGLDLPVTTALNGHLFVRQLFELASMLMHEGWDSRRAFTTWQHRRSSRSQEDGHEYGSGWWEEVGFEDQYPERDYD